MRIDASVLAILDRKYRRLAQFSDQQDYIGWLNHLTPLIRWIWSVPMLRSYVKAIITMHDVAERELERDTRAWVAEITPLVERFRSEVTTSSEVAGEWIEPHDWRRIDSSLVTARAEDTSIEDRRTTSKDAASVLRIHARQASTDAWSAIYTPKHLLKHARESWLSVEPVEAEPHPGLDVRVRYLEQVLADALALEPRVRPLIEEMSALTEVQIHRVDEWELVMMTSPFTAFRRLISACRSQSPPVDGVKHWTEFLPLNPFGDAYNKLALKTEWANVYAEARDDLPTFVDELHVLGASTLSNLVVVGRFKERCTWYDKARMREIALARGAGREDRLTLELAKYLHDNGIFVLVRARVGNHEPDAFAPLGLAIEAKAYSEKKGNARKEVVGAFAQLHAYMTSLETEAVRVTEGFVVAFRLGGPIYVTERAVDTGHFLIHFLTIDLGVSADSGRKQPRPILIPEGEIIDALGAPKATRSTKKGEKAARSSAGTRRSRARQ